MYKTIEIRGMVCGHCAAHIERALNGMQGVRAKVDLATKTAVLESAYEVPDEEICAVVQDAGYEVISIH
jgi:copper chaperone CopZ